MCGFGGGGSYTCLFTHLTFQLKSFVILKKNSFPCFKGGSTRPFNTIEVESLKNGLISLAGRTFHRACLLKSKFSLRELEIQRNYPLGLLALKMPLKHPRWNNCAKLEAVFHKLLVKILSQVTSWRSLRRVYSHDSFIFCGTQTNELSCILWLLIIFPSFNIIIPLDILL